jgi:serine/threonine protein kinase
MTPEMIPAGSVNLITNNCDQFEEDTRNFKKEYTVGKPLGKGGFGEVFLATRRIDGAKVAIKFVTKAKSEEVSLYKFIVLLI